MHNRDTNAELREAVHFVRRRPTRRHHGFQSPVAAIWIPIPIVLRQGDGAIAHFAMEEN